MSTTVDNASDTSAPHTTCDERRGTVTGYWRHRRAGETSCEDCRAAVCAYDRARRAAHRTPDEIRISRAISGDNIPRLTPPERDIVVAALTGKGWSATRIAAHLSCHPRTIVRARARARKAEPIPVAPDPTPDVGDLAAAGRRVVIGGVIRWVAADTPARRAS
jgi:hypothetical protein